jgi:tagatose-1,6-bisphosphate aldolase non-catalytic subunit AgaZ/GatZ
MTQFFTLLALAAANLELNGPKERALESRWSKMLGAGADRLPGVHFKQTDTLHHQRDVADSKVSLLEEESGPKERALESKWSKMLGTGADRLPGVHFKQTDTLHHQRDVADSKVAFLAKPHKNLEKKWSKILDAGEVRLPGVHFKATDTLHHQRDVASGRDVSLLEEEAGPKERKLESKWSKMLGVGEDRLPGVHFKQTDTLHHQRDVADSKVSLLQQQAGPKERALESRWSKMLGAGADRLPGVHFKQTDVLHAQRDAASSKP